VRALRPEVPAGLEAVVARLLAKQPSARYAAPAEVVEALGPFAASGDLPALVAAGARAEDSAKAHPAPVGETVSQGLLTTPQGPAPLPSPVRRLPVLRRRYAPWAVLLLALLAVGGLLALLASWRLRGEDSSPGSTSVKARPGPARGVWHDALEKPPGELLWPKDSPRPQWDENRLQLTVNCDELGLLSLGTLPDAGYKIQLGIKQPRWSGGIGLFFGYHAEPRGEKSCFSYQQILLQPYLRGRGEGKPLIFLRSKGIICSSPGQGILTSSQGVASQPVSMPEPHEQLLEIEVSRKARLLRVRWAGEELPGLVSADANNSFTPADFVGEFGTCNLMSASVVSTARFMLLEKEEP
jgi:hypothetical protein